MKPRQLHLLHNIITHHCLPRAAATPSIPNAARPARRCAACLPSIRSPPRSAPPFQANPDAAVVAAQSRRFHLVPASPRSRRESSLHHHLSRSRAAFRVHRRPSIHRCHRGWVRRVAGVTALGGGSHHGRRACPPPSLFLSVSRFSPLKQQESLLSFFKFIPSLSLSVSLHFSASLSPSVFLTQQGRNGLSPPLWFSSFSETNRTVPR